MKSDNFIIHIHESSSHWEQGETPLHRKSALLMYFTTEYYHICNREKEITWWERNTVKGSKEKKMWQDETGKFCRSWAIFSLNTACFLFFFVAFGLLIFWWLAVDPTWEERLSGWYVSQDQVMPCRAVLVSRMIRSDKNWPWKTFGGRHRRAKSKKHMYQYSTSDLSL